MTKKEIKGRGSSSDCPGRFEKTIKEPFDDGWEKDVEEPSTETIIKWDLAKSIINSNDSPDIPYEISINQYRGCEHGCIYCFARPSHSFLGLSPGLDFERKIFAKQDAVELLKKELSNPNYKPTPVALGINTDSYQPIERKLKITRNILELLSSCQHPIWLVTKSALIERDIDILSEMAKKDLVEAAVSITSLNPDITRKLEPRAANPQRRLKIISNLAKAGIPTTVLMAPIIPSVNDHEIESILKSAKDAGASASGYVVLRLPHELPTVFKEWLETHMPDKSKKIMSQIKQIHGGKIYNSESFTRHKGSGVLAKLIEKRFEVAMNKYDLKKPKKKELRCDIFIRPGQSGTLL